ncbi:dihydropteroate synthase [Nocardioides mangrovicus]|uniref:Dihydropteroate synthase n=1 Tax=Nocardioides mangrovicus TaxID=2478913 RepID=A0A3L8P5E5_9ACTN|nr:dihydropteroate synthase [Nocardioides mangrovicus]RLV50445.1 dihydropteroate synthase [Nocardioides mangrovicus]
MNVPPLTRRHVVGLPVLDRPVVMGVVNVTPDSFSDGGRWVDADRAVAHGLSLRADGADLLDIGGESTRPGATRPLVAEEIDRVLPVIKQLAAEGAWVSVDTMRAEVAEAALAAGAVLVNDVSGGLADPRILRVVADAGAAYVAMHWRAHSNVMQQHAAYDDVVAEVTAELGQRVAAALAAGVAADRIAVDPGLGFAKTADHNWRLLRHLDALDALGLPVLVGSSRKSFLGTLLADEAGPRPVEDREDANTALTAMAALAGVWGVRVHDARKSIDAIKVVSRWSRDD